MKILSKVILGLSLSAQVFSAPLEERQSDGFVATVEAALNRLLGRVLTEVGLLNSAIVGLGSFSTPGTLAAVNSDLVSIASSLGSATSIIGGATAGTTCTLSAADAATLLNSVGTYQIIVNSIQASLQTAVPTLSAGDISSITTNIQTLELSINNFTSTLQSYTTSIVPCLERAAPNLGMALGPLMGSLSTTVQSLIDALGAGGALNGLVTAVIP